MVNASQSNVIIKCIGITVVSLFTFQSPLLPATRIHATVYTHLGHPPTMARFPHEERTSRVRPPACLAVGKGHDGRPTGLGGWQHTRPPCTSDVCLGIITLLVGAAAQLDEAEQ